MRQPRPHRIRFLANAETESLKYQLIIASPVISSGISIQHQHVSKEQRFTLGLYVGGGYASTPSDAVQQLRRVRYLTQFVIGLRQLGKRAQEVLDYQAQIRAAEMAIALEGVNQQLTSFDHLVADIRAQDELAKKDFAVGILWQMDAAGWTLIPSSHGPGKAFTSVQATAASEIHNQYIATMISAPILDRIEAQRLQRLHQRTEAQNLMLEAYELRSSLGVLDAPITRVLVEF